MTVFEMKVQFKRCDQCKKPLLTSYRESLCIECIYLNKNENETEHSRLIRCPRCRNKMSMYEFENIFTDETHNVTCIHCDYEFEIVTYLEYSFQSPKVIK